MVVTVNILMNLRQRPRHAASRSRRASKRFGSTASQSFVKPSGPVRHKEIRAWLDSLCQFSEKIPPLPEHISREWLYQDRDSMAIPSCLCNSCSLRQLLEILR
jgi:hypothetical protein